MHSSPLENLMDQPDVGMNILVDPCSKKNPSPVIPTTISLPVIEPIHKTVIPVSQLKKTVTIGASNQVICVLLVKLHFHQLFFLIN